MCAMKKKEYPIYCRKRNKKRTEHIILDVNKLAKGHDYIAVVGLEISPDNNYLAYGIIFVSRRVYTLKIKNLTKKTLKDTIEATSGG